MKPRFSQISVVLIAGALLTACAAVSGQRMEATASGGGYGTNPTLPKPRPTLIPESRNERLCRALQPHRPT